MKSLSKIYKSSHITPKSPLVWECKPEPQTNNTQEQLAHEPDGLIETDQKSSEGDLEKIYEEARKKAKKEAQGIIEQAKLEKEQLLEEAKEAGYQQGYEQGFQEGQANGLEQIQQKKEHLLEEATHVLNSAKQDYQEIVRKSETDICELILEISQQIVSDGLKNQQELLVEMVKKGLNKLTDHHHVVVRTHPEDFDQLEKHLLALKDEFPDINIDLKKDDQLRPGAPLLFGENGHIELDINKLLKEFR